MHQLCIEKLFLLFSYLGNWYTISVKARRLLTLIQMRSRVPSQITAGKIYPLSLETFSTVRCILNYYNIALQDIKTKHCFF